MSCSIECSPPTLNGYADLTLTDATTRSREPYPRRPLSTLKLCLMIAPLAWCAIGSLSEAVDAHPFHLHREDLLFPELLALSSQLTLYILTN